MISGIGGTIIGYIKAGRAEDARQKSEERQCAFEKDLAALGQLAAYKEKSDRIVIKTITTNNEIKFTIWDKEFGFRRNKSSTKPVVSPSQWLSHCIIGGMSLTYCFIDILFAYNAERVIYALSPDNAISKWSLAFGLVSKDTNNPEIIAITLGGLAFWMVQPIITLVASAVTGITYKLLRA